MANKIKSLRDQINERLNLKKGGKKTASSNIRKASHDFAASDAPQFRGKSKKKRHQMAVAAGLSAARGESAIPKVGDMVMYEGKKVRIQALNESGMAVVKFSNHRDPIIVRSSDLTMIQKTELTEGFLGMAPIGPTYREPSNYGFMKLDLNPEDIGLGTLREDEFTGKEDEQEDVADNGSNIRYDGHTGKTQVDSLPKPSDTIVPAYDSNKPPKEMGKPLSIAVGAEESKLWQEPNWDGYDYPADAPQIPTADFNGDEAGNPRAPCFGDEHEPDVGNANKKDKKDEKKDEAEDRTDEGYMGFGKLEKKLSHKAGIRNPGAVAASIGRKKYGNKKFQSAATQGHKLGESGDKWIQGTDVDKPGHKGGLHKALGVPQDKTIPKSKVEKASHSSDSHIRHMAQFAKNVNEGEVCDPARDASEESKERNAMRKDLDFVAEMDDMLGHDQEPKAGDTITVTLPAMASILVTIARRMGADVQEGGEDEVILKSLVEALAEVSKGKTIDIEDLDAVASHMNGEETQEIENREAGRPDHEGIEGMGHKDDRKDAEIWPGDGEKSKSGKTKLMGGVSENNDYFGVADVMEGTQLTDEEELRIVKRRAGLRFW